MAIYLYTVESTFRDEFGLNAERGIPLNEINKRPELKSMRQGIVLELQLPDQRKLRTHLVNYGIGVTKQADSSLAADSEPALRFTLPSELTTADVPPGTRVCWLDDEPGMSHEEVEK